MPLHLDREIVKWTIDHILKNGDTDIFPHPFEFQFFSERKDEISESISKIDLYNYRPVNFVESLVPKSKNGFRLGHQLYPVDAIIFTAAVVTIGSDLERGRIPINENIAFSYRFDQQTDGEMLDANHRYRDWLNHSFIQTLFNDDTTHVVKTDIADFYSRIYHHRLENSLSDLTNSSPFAKFIIRWLGDHRAKQSFGIPVGGNAARLLAEIALADTDNALRNEGYTHTRYVDDFLILSPKVRLPMVPLHS